MVPSLVFAIKGKYDDAGVEDAKKNINEFAKGASANINKFTSGMRNSTSGISSLCKSITHIGSAIPAIGAVTAVVAMVGAGVSKVKKQINECMEEWAKDEQEIAKVKFATKINNELKGAGNSLTDYFNNLENISHKYYTTADIISASSKMLLDKNEEQIKKVTKASIDLASATGEDLSSAVEQLNATYSGTAGALAKIFPELKNLTEEQLKNGEAIDIVAKKCDGFASKMGTTVAGSIKESKEASSELKSELGNLFSTAFTPMRNFFTEFKKNLADSLAYARLLKEAKNNINSGTSNSEDYKRLLEDAQKKLSESRENLTKLLNAQKNPVGGYAPSQTIIDNKKTEIKNLEASLNSLAKKYDELKKTEQNNSVEIGKNTTATTTNTKELGKKEKIEFKPVFSDIKLPTFNWANNASPFAVQPNIAKTDSRMFGEDLFDFDEIGKKAKETTTSILANMKYMVKEIGTTIASNIGEIGEIINAVASSGWIGMIITLIAKFLQALSEKSEKFQEFMNLISTIFEEIANNTDILQLVEDIIQPFFDGATNLSSILQTIIKEFLTLIDSVFQPIFSFLTSTIAMIAPLFESFGNIINALMQCNPLLAILSGVLQLISTVCLFLYNNIIVPIYNAIIVIFNGIVNAFTGMYNWICDIVNAMDVFDWYSDMKHKGYRDWNEGQISKIDTLKPDTTTNNKTNDDTSTGSSGASYTAQKDVYVTINFSNSFVTGDARQIAIMLKKEITSAEKMGYC